MFESFRDDRWRTKGSNPKPVRLFLEELEGRFLLSLSLYPNGGIVAGGDGNIWANDCRGVDRLDPATGVIQQFDLPSIPVSLQGITLGSDNAIWLTQGNQVARIDPITGASKEFGVTSVYWNANDIISGPDGKMWFEDDNWFGRIDPSTWGEQEVYAGISLNRGQFSGSSMAVGSDGGIWFLDKIRIGRFDPSTGDVQVFWLPGNGRANGIAAGPDGSIWYTGGDNRIGRIDSTTGAIKEFGSVAGSGITGGPDSSLWFIATPPINCSPPPGQPEISIGRINPTTGDMQFFAIPQGAMPIGSITSDKMGNIWFMVGTNGGEGFGEFMPISGTFAFFQPGMKSSPPPPTSGSTKAGAAATGTTLSATPGVNFMTAVAAFTPQTPIASPGQAYQATIDWGDGTNSSLDNATYDVTAGHTYQSAGTYSIKVTIGNYNPANPLGDDAVTVFSTANVDPFNFTM